MNNVKLVWATIDADKHVGYCARVSNPTNQDNPNIKGLLSYCANNHHWSVFEMASACLEINTTRDIARQLLRHRSFSFQELSQRYSDVSVLGDFVTRDCRTQDNKNRQNSFESQDDNLNSWWSSAQAEVITTTKLLYEEALKKGVAKEQARALLPEGMTPSRVYVTGTLRSWITYCQVRTHESTQSEHRDIARGVLSVLSDVAPITMSAFSSTMNAVLK